MSSPSQAKFNTTTRRQFVKGAAIGGLTIITAPNVAFSYQRNEALRMASIGAGGMASGGVSAGLKEHLVAVAEVDHEGKAKNNIERIRKESPHTKIYTDFRELFDKHKELDAVCIGTPDHNHFPAAIRALEAGAGVYCEKPLTWSVYEARKLREVANEKKLPTQMGNQGHSSESIRQIVEHLRAGSLGKLKEIHCVSNRGFSAKSRGETQPVPKGLDWDAWLGPAPYREFHGGLHPFSWRGWLDFGTGSLGDMGCHTIDGAVWGLKLFEADSFEVEAELGSPTEDGFAKEAVIVYRFPKRGDMPPITLTWHHGGQLPPLPEGYPETQKPLNQGTYYVGEKGRMTSGSHCGGVKLWPEAFANKTAQAPKIIPRAGNHRGDFINACKNADAPRPSSHFDYAARLTEIVLLGNIACAVGEAVTYDMAKGQTNNDKANAMLNRRPRKGWEFGYDA